MTTAPAERPARIAVVYYSARGNVHGLVRAVAQGAASVGAEVRLRHVAELNQELLISAKQYWGRHRSEIEDEPDGGGNPYGASFTSDHHTGGPDEDTLVVARAQGARLARVAQVVGAARHAGLLTAKPARSDAADRPGR